MSTHNTAPRRPATTVLAVFDILVGLVGSVSGLFLTALMLLSVHPEDMVPPLGLAVACGLLGVTGVLLLPDRPGRGAAWAAGLAGATAVGGIACAIWRHIALRPSEGGMLLLAGLMAPVALVALAEVAYVRRARAAA